jgi:hypothetical protein
LLTIESTTIQIDINQYREYATWENANWRGGAVASSFRLIMVTIKQLNLNIGQRCSAPDRLIDIVKAGLTRGQTRDAEQSTAIYTIKLN